MRESSKFIIVYISISMFIIQERLLSLSSERGPNEPELERPPHRFSWVLSSFLVEIKIRLFGPHSCVTVDYYH